MQSKGILLCTICFLLFATSHGVATQLLTESLKEFFSVVVNNVMEMLVKHNNDENTEFKESQDNVGKEHSKQTLGEHLMKIKKAIAYFFGKAEKEESDSEERHYAIAFEGDAPKNKLKAFNNQVLDLFTTFVNKIGIALAQQNKEKQAEEPRGSRNREFSVLQSLKSGRVEGPVHVYGQHDDDEV